MKSAITGGSGYIGSRLTELLAGRDETERIVDLDVRPPDVPWPKTEYVRGNVRDLAVLEAAWAAGVGQVLVTSSASAYGAFPDNPVPIAEDHPVRGQPDFSYARDKAEADRVCQLWAADHPDRVMTIVRPTIVFGPNVDNYISRAWGNNAFFPIMDGVEPDFQLVHEDD